MIWGAANSEVANGEWPIPLTFYSLFAISLFARSPMLILAIDTALDACAAGVLDTDAGKLIAQESQAMKRGHAEALMPLIARVIQAVRRRIRRRSTASR